jgi:outer membrane immunogenic protein
MKTISALALATAIALVVGDRAPAADLPVRAAPFQPPAAVPVDPWTGFYGGLSLGGRWSNSTWTTTSIPSIPVVGAPDPSTAAASFDSASVRFGGYIGFNWHFAPAWVAGIEGDVAWANNTKTVSGIPGTYGTTIAGIEGAGAQATVPGPDTTKVTEKWDDGVRGRLGYLLSPGLLLFATGGVSWINLNASANCVLFSAGGPFCVDPTHPSSETASSTRTGWTVGGGLEAVLASHWLLRGEYRFADYGTMSHTYFAASVNDAFVANIKVQTHTGLVGLAYKF